MEDVDNITLQTLRAVGCSIDNDVRGVSQLSANTIVQATSICLEKIHPELAGDEDPSGGLPRRLPPALSARFTVAHRLAQLIKEDGYKGDLGYQTFLYPNERDTRTLLMYLVEHLPKDSVHMAEEMLSSSAALARVVSEAIQSDLNAPWIPWYCRADKVVLPHRGNVARRLVVGEVPPEDHPMKDTISRLAARVPPVHRQARKELGYSLHRSLLERSADLLALEQFGGEAALCATAAVSRSTRKEVRQEQASAKQEAVIQAEKQMSSAATKAKLAGDSQEKDAKSAEEKADDEQEVTETKEERRERQENETQEARDTLNEVERRLERLDAKRERLMAKMSAAKTSVDDLKERCRLLEEEAATKRRTAELLPSATYNAAKLEREVMDQRAHMEKLENEWSTKSAPVAAELNELRSQHASRRALSQRKEAELEEARTALRECTDELRRRDEQLVSLREKVGKLESAPNRASYTRRILDIVANIKKQKLEVDRVLGQTRGLQKEINAVSGKLERTFTETDELVFRDARKDDTVRKAYKLLASLHSNCESLVTTEEERGALLRETRELEEQVEGQKRRTQEGQLETVVRDCDEMRALNENLKKALKAHMKQAHAEAEQ